MKVSRLTRGPSAPGTLCGSSCLCCPSIAASQGEERDTARIIFDVCDADKDGLVSRSDLELTLRKLFVKSEGSRAIFATYDKDGDGALEY
mmetsp:Transcript_86794/g.221123  ORF Transcript_86794/g.221123 Transcript_86794/m.221123 type:complete len:90 (+) Transcript_86794:3-272(+)